jgi:hypothetical protein
VGDWNRSTFECKYEILPEDIRTEIQKHLEIFNLGLITSNYLTCIKTTSEKKKKGLFSGGGNKLLISYVILTPTWLIYATSGDKSGIGILSAQLKDLNITDFKDSPEFQILKDTGLYITGIFTGKTGIHGDPRVSTFIPLGEEPAADQFKERLMQAYQSTRKSV